MTSDPSIDARDLVKTYPGGRGRPPVHALDGLSLHVLAGEVFGLLGPNGAGKSTTVKILTTLARQDSGTAQVTGHDVRTHPDRVRRAIGLVPQRQSSDPMASGRENLHLTARIHGLTRHDAAARASELLDRFELADAADRQVKTYSGGMSRKLDVAIGLVNRPQVLFLDEPTTGLDPEARAQMWAEISSLADQEQMAILLTTHYLDEADKLAGRVAIVDHGRIVVEGTPEGLKSELRGDTVRLDLERPEDLAAAAERFQRIDGVDEITAEGRTIRARTGRGAGVVTEALSALGRDGFAVAAASVSRPSLDDVYLRHVGHELEVAR